MAPKSLTVFLSLFFLSLSQCQNIHTNRIDDMDNEIHVENSKEDVNPFAEVASAFMQGEHGGDLGGMLNNFIQADGGKTIGNMLMGAVSQNEDATSQILSGIGSMLSNNEAGAALNPSLIGNMISMMAAAGGGDQSKHGSSNDAMTSTIMSLVGNFLTNQNQQQQASGEQFDFGSIISFLSNFMKNSGENPAELLLSFANSFLGPEARLRESEHAAHAYMLPPLLEKAHIYFDHFKHTELYNALWRVTGAEKFFNMYATDGKFNFAKFFERLENQSFRKHWLMVVTRKLTDIIAVVTDSKRYKKYVNTGVSLFNGFLKSVDFPKSTLFDITRPTETLTKFFNYLFKKYLSMKVDSTPYVEPAVKYVEEIISLAHKKGLLFRDGLDSRALSHKLTDTINLEMIEPVARVYRAYRFAKKEPECDKYVMCVINQDDSNQVVSLPGLKTSLSKSASLVVSWFLSQRTGTSFWTLYSAIYDEKDCSIRFLEKCNGFHVEESKVTQEYEHTEL